MFSALELKIITGLAAVAALLVMFGLYTAHQREIGAATVRAAHAEKALAAEQESRRESDRRTVAIQQKANDADQAASAARADADAARSADERLRLRLVAAERRRAPVNPAATASSSPADSPALVPYDVFARVDEAAGQLGDYADQLRVSLDACIGSYRALTP